MIETMIVFGSLVVLLAWLRAIENKVQVSPQRRTTSRRDSSRG